MDPIRRVTGDALAGLLAKDWARGPLSASELTSKACVARLAP